MSGGSAKYTQLEESAKSLLETAVIRDKEERFTEAKICYEEGSEKLLSALKLLPEKSAKREHLRSRILQYLDRAETIKNHIETQKQAGQYHEQFQITDNSTGHTYEKIFSPYIDAFLKSVEVDDPYIKAHHQIVNFVRFCEVLVKSSAPVSKITLTTKLETHQDQRVHQQSAFTHLTESLKVHKIVFSVQYSEALHDREIRFDSGWIIKIGRGLDIFKPPVSKYSIGAYDMELRPCLSTTVDVFHKAQLKTRP